VFLKHSASTQKFEQDKILPHANEFQAVPTFLLGLHF